MPLVHVLLWATISLIIGVVWGVLSRRFIYQSHLFLLFDHVRYMMLVFGSLVIFLLIRSVAEATTISALIDVKVYSWITMFSIGAMLGFACEPRAKRKCKTPLKAGLHIMEDGGIALVDPFHEVNDA